MTDKLNEIKSALENAREIAVYCHTNPDGDTIACALSLFHALTKVGKTVTLYCDSEIPAKYAFLNGADKFELPKKGVHELGIALDCSDLDRLGGGAKAFVLQIDPCRRPPQIAFAFCFRLPRRSRRVSMFRNHVPTA